MDTTRSILKDIRESLGLTSTTIDFDTELLMHINTAISKLNQNGIGIFLIVNGEEETWDNLLDPLQIEGNKYSKMIPLYISLSTKLLFDPPPPSSVEYHTRSVDELLWRLKTAYEEPYVKPITEVGEQ